MRPWPAPQAPHQLDEVRADPQLLGVQSAHRFVQRAVVALRIRPNLVELMRGLGRGREVDAALA
jgi:hypothetical protein